MNIIFCHAGKAHPKAEAAVRVYAPEAQFIDTSATEFRYWEVLREFWRGKEDLITLEQDIEITAEVIPSFKVCDEPWCSYQYLAMRGWVLDSSLGCTKFSAEIQRAVPFDEMADYTLTQMAGYKIPSSSRLTWKYCDYRIFSHLKYRGYRPHVHGSVKHYHPYPIGEANALVQQAIENYICIPSELSLHKVRQALDFAQTGELNAANSVLLCEQEAFP